MKIETGASPERAAEISEETAGRIRREWAAQVKQATPYQVAGLLVEHFDRVTAVYFHFGRELVEKWREGEQGRGQVIPGSEMREMVDRWTETQQPVLTAYDDNLELAYRELTTSGIFADDFRRILKRLVDEYYGVYSAVFLPMGTLGEYEHRLEQVEYEAEAISQEYRDYLERF
ncbi:MAG: hypothetical protein AB1483_12885 [Candidatus Zixiibacteriota bacterium]